MAVIHGSYKVFIGGKDITSKLKGFLIQLTVEKTAGKASDTASITVADPDGVIVLPKERDEVKILINGLDVYEGFVDEVNSDYNKGNGHILEISSSSVDLRGKAKEPQLQHKDDATLVDVAKEFGSKADIKMEASGSIATIKRDYWLQQNESFMSWGQRIASDVGGTFKIIGKRGFLTSRNEGLSISGKKLTPVNVRGGQNLLDGSIQPNIGRPKYKKVSTTYFDFDKAERISVDVDTSIKGTDATFRSPLHHTNKDQAKDRATSVSKESDRAQGQGSVTIIGDEAAEPEAEAVVAGFRSGVDGTYRIDSVSHSIDKGGGFTTSLSLRQPSGGAGTDNR